jgi:hypothetical protein
MVYRKTFASSLLAAMYLLSQIAAGGNPVTDSARSRAPAALPPTTGPFAVGKITVHWTDESRIEPLSPNHEPRELMVDIWYPAERSDGVLAGYLDAAAYEKAIGADGFQKFFGEASETLKRGVQTTLLRLHHMRTPQSRVPC